MDTALLGGTPTTPATNDATGSFKHNSIVTVDSPEPGTPADSDNLTPTEPIDKGILEGVVAFVDVRSQNENRSSCIIKELCQLGAEVVPKFTNEVTHVIFKDGKQATREKATKKGIHLVSVLWIDNCKRNQSHLSEKLFRPSSEIQKTPGVGRLKKMKSMQPMDFEEELARSVERSKNKRPRKEFSPKWKIMETPYSPHLQRTIYVEDTQPKSPDLDTMFITIPDTPPSMRLKMQELMEKRIVLDQDCDITPQAPGKECDPLQRRLFDLDTSTETISPAPSRSSDCEVTTPPHINLYMDANATMDTNQTVITIAAKPSKKKHKLFCTIPEVEPPLEILKPTEASNAMQTKPMLFTPKTKVSDGPRRKVGRGAKRSNNSEADSESHAVPGGVQKRQCVTRRQSISVSTPTNNSINASEVKAQKRSRRSMAVQPMTTVNVSLPLQDNAKTHSTSKSENYQIEETNEQVSNSSVRLYSDSLPDQQESSSHEIPFTPRRSKRQSMAIDPTSGYSADFNSTADDSVLVKIPKKHYLKNPSCAKKKKSTAYQTTDLSSFGTALSQEKPADKPTFSCLSHSRKSLEDFHPSQFKSGKNKLASLREQSIETSEDSETCSSAGSQRRGRKTNRSSSEDSQKGSYRRKKPKKTLVITSMCLEDKDMLQSIIKQLGSYHVISDVTESTTHVVCGGARRTLNVLYAIVRGAWLVSKEWVMESLEAGEWIDEEPFELHDYFPAAQKSRLQKVTSGDNFHVNLLSRIGYIYVADQTSPPHHHIVSLIKLVGGQVTHCARKADLCIGIGLGDQRDQVCITEQWLLDSITSFRCMPYTKYPIQKERRERETSPDF